MLQTSPVGGADDSEARPGSCHAQSDSNDIQPSQRKPLSTGQARMAKRDPVYSEASLAERSTARKRGRPPSDPEPAKRVQHVSPARDGSSSLIRREARGHDSATEDRWQRAQKEPHFIATYGPDDEELILRGDNVFMYCEGEHNNSRPPIGQVISIGENTSNQSFYIRWYYHASSVRYLRRPHTKELFLSDQFEEMLCLSICGLAEVEQRSNR